MDIDSNDNLAQNKVLILYILKNVRHNVTESDLFKLVLSVDNINYFYFKQILTDLIDSKLVQAYSKDEINKDNQETYELTDEGENSLSLTIDILPGLLKLKADTVLKKEISNIIAEDSIVTEYISENEHSHTIKCKIVENNEVIFEIRAFAGSDEQAQIISSNWKNNANTIYPKVLRLLSGQE